MARFIRSGSLRLITLLVPFILGVPTLLAGMETDDYYSRTLRSASEFDYPPFALVRQDGSADGFSVDLLKAVAQEARFRIKITVGPWNEIKQKLIKGELDVLPLVSYSKDRDRVLDFTFPYLRMHGTIFVRKGDTRIRDREDLKDKELLVMKGDTAHEYAVREKLSDHLILTKSFEEAMTLLSEGKHDAVVIQQLVGLQLIKKLGISNLDTLENHRERSLKPSSKPLVGFEQKFCLAVKEGDVELLARLNEGLAVVIANGTYDHLYDKWFSPILPPAPISWKKFLTYLIGILVPLLILILLIGVWYLKREVAAKTLSLRQEIQERKKAQKEKDQLITELTQALEDVKTLGGLLPICASCKKIRDDNGYWNQIETYIREHSQAEFSHSLCPECLPKYYPED